MDPPLRFEHRAWPVPSQTPPAPWQWPGTKRQNDPRWPQTRGYYMPLPFSPNSQGSPGIPLKTCFRTIFSLHQRRFWEQVLAPKASQKRHWKTLRITNKRSNEESEQSEEAKAYRPDDITASKHHTRETWSVRLRNHRPQGPTPRSTHPGHHTSAFACSNEEVDSEYSGGENMDIWRRRRRSCNMETEARGNWTRRNQTKSDKVTMKQAARAMRIACVHNAHMCKT